MSDTTFVKLVVDEFTLDVARDAGLGTADPGNHGRALEDNFVRTLLTSALGSAPPVNSASNEDRSDRVAGSAPLGATSMHDPSAGAIKELFSCALETLLGSKFFAKGFIRFVLPGVYAGTPRGQAVGLKFLASGFNVIFFSPSNSSVGGSGGRSSIGMGTKVLGFMMGVTDGDADGVPLGDPSGDSIGNNVNLYFFAFLKVEKSCKLFSCSLY